MKYYYLNEDKKPQGPYNENELAAFKQSGLINDETLAAVAGDSKWRRLGDLLNKDVEADCSTWNIELGNVLTANRCSKALRFLKFVLIVKNLYMEQTRDCGMPFCMQ